MTAYTDRSQSDSTWLGSFPSHWRNSRLGYEAVVNAGQVDPRQEPWRSMTLVAPNHIESGTGRMSARESAAAQGAESGKYQVRAGQVMYSKIRPALNKVTIATEDCLCSADMYAMSFRAAVLPKYAFYYMLARPFHSFATITSMRVKMPKINREELAEVPWLVPPWYEQQAIADYLDRETAKIDTLIEEQQSLIDLLSERRLAVSELAVASLDWSTPLRSVTSLIQTGPFGSQLKSDEYEPGGTPVINPSHLVGGRIVPGHGVAVGEQKAEELSRHELRDGDLVASRRGELGRCAVTTPESAGYLCGTGSLVVRPVADRLDPRFLRLVFASRCNKDALALASIGSTMDNLNASIVGALRIPLPTIKTQRTIVVSLAEQISKIDTLVAESGRFIELASERRSALITAAVTGQVDVREEVAA